MTFNSTEYWKNRYAKGGHSGLGSYGDLAKYKANFINGFIKFQKIDNLIEYGCGDGNQLALIKCKNIKGIDVSLDALQLCRNKMPDRVFTNNLEVAGCSDLVLSLDVIYHLIEDSVYNDYMANITRMAYKYIIIYAPNYESDEFAKHVKPRKFTDHPALAQFKLIHHEPNKYPSTDHNTGSFSEFNVFERIIS